MRLKFWQHSKPAQVPCTRCSQLLDRDALECPMCGLDLRERIEPAHAEVESPAPRLQ